MLPLAICNHSGLLAGQACSSRHISPGKVRVEGHQNLHMVPVGLSSGRSQWRNCVCFLSKQGYNQEVRVLGHCW